MKSPALCYLIGILILATSLHAQTKKPPITAPEGWRGYGSTVTMKKRTSLADALKNRTNPSSKEIMVEGTISEVCQNKGCWMVVADGKSTVRVEFKDYTFFVPWNSDGKRVRLQGKVEQKNVSAKAAKHMAGEMKSPPVKPEEIKEQQDIVVFTASAVAIEDGDELSEEQRDILEGGKEREGHIHEEE